MRNLQLLLSDKGERIEGEMIEGERVKRGQRTEKVSCVPYHHLIRPKGEVGRQRALLNKGGLPLGCVLSLQLIMQRLSGNLYNNMQSLTINKTSLLPHL